MIKVASGTLAIALAAVTVLDRISDPAPTSLSLNRASQTPPDASRAERYSSSRFMRNRDQFPGLDYPQVVHAEDATFLRAEDEVLGFVVDGIARAYPTTVVGYHHVINDHIGDTYLTVTF